MTSSALRTQVSSKLHYQKRGRKLKKKEGPAPEVIVRVGGVGSNSAPQAVLRKRGGGGVPSVGGQWRGRRAL